MNKYQRSLIEASWGDLAVLGSVYRTCLNLHDIRDRQQLNFTKSAVRELAHNLFPGTISSRKPKNDLIRPNNHAHWPFNVLPKLVVIAPATLSETVIKCIEAIDGLPELLIKIVETVEYGENINDAATSEFDAIGNKLDNEASMDFVFIGASRDKDLPEYTTAVEYLKKLQIKLEIELATFKILTEETFNQWAKHLPKKAPT